MGQDKGPPWTESSQPATQAKQVQNVSAMLLSQHMPGQDLLKGTEYRENNIDPIYILLGNKPTET